VWDISGIILAGETQSSHR